MRVKKIGCFFIVLLLFSGLMCSVDAVSNLKASFRGVDVTIDLTYPEEARQNTTITHDVTITANTNLTLINIGIFIYAPVNSTLQLIKSQPLSWGQLDENESLPTSPFPILLPQQANGILYCNMTVQTEIDTVAHYTSYSFYTTFVSELTFSEMQALQAEYQSLLDEYNDLVVNYSSLFDNYTELLDEYNVLSGKYNTQVAIYQTLLDNYNKLSGEYDALNADYSSKINEFNTLEKDYNELNSTRNGLQANYTRLQADYNQLNQTYNSLVTQRDTLQTDFNNSQVAVENDRTVMFIFVIALVALIAFIIYLKRGKEEPYVVIRKETVNMKEKGS